MKKTIIFTLIFSLLYSGIMTKAALESGDVGSLLNEIYQMDHSVVSSIETANNWAYKDYSKANSMEKVYILKARSIILQNTDWVADSMKGYYTAPDGTVEEVPQFSVIFPDWNLEQIWAYNATIFAKEEKNGYLEIQPYVGVHIDKTFDTTVYLKSNTMAPYVYLGSSIPYALLSELRTEVVSLYSIIRCNIGYGVNYDGNIYDIGHKLDVPIGGSFSVYNVANIYWQAYSIYGRYSAAAQGTGRFHFIGYS